jgi:hypothetical protein
MTTIDKCKVCFNKGFTYNKSTGIICGIKGGPIIKKVRNYLYISFRYNKKVYGLYAHQFAFFYIYGYVPNMIDHRNRNILDNSIINLRPCNNSINQINTSNKGYYKANNCDRYIAVCNIGTKKYIGSFKTEEDAHNAYLEYRSIFIT